MRDEDPIPAELAFFTELERRVPGIQDWYHADPDGTLWMIASYDLVVGKAIHKTLRVDYDAVSLRGGTSPGFLNWDGGVRAHDAGVDTSPPDGLDLEVTDPINAADAAATWFLGRIATWRPG